MHVLTKLFHLGGEKLGSVEVIVTVEGSGEPLGGVLVSLSGESYRSNQVTDAVTGRYTFSALHSGQYFLRALLKEYKFLSPVTVSTPFLHFFSSPTFP